MPELAEVEFYRKQWNSGVGKKITCVELHPGKRIFRGTDTDLLQRTLTGSTLLRSVAHGKQMLFEFSKGAWLGIHLGMSGKLRVEANSFVRGKHDHLVLRQAEQALAFSDPRQFGRVLFHRGKDQPPWWVNLPPDLFSPQFTADTLQRFLKGHRKAPIKAVLLLQSGFPGIGNWMADEILWQARIHPRVISGELDSNETKRLWGNIRMVSLKAMETVGEDFSDPPKSWLFHQRWPKRGNCPRCGEELAAGTIGGRTTRWCPQCQPAQRRSARGIS